MDNEMLSLPRKNSDPQHYNSGCIVNFVGSGYIIQHISYSSPYIISLGIRSVFDRTEGLLSKLEVFGQANTNKARTPALPLSQFRLKEVIGMLKKQDNWKIVSWYCPNCGRLIGGIPNAEGKIKASCGKCKTEMVLKNKGRRHDTLELFAPQPATT